MNISTETMLIWIFQLMLIGITVGQPPGMRRRWSPPTQPGNFRSAASTTGFRGRQPSAGSRTFTEQDFNNNEFLGPSVQTRRQTLRHPYSSATLQRRPQMARTWPSRPTADAIKPPSRDVTSVRRRPIRIRQSSHTQRSAHTSRSGSPMYESQPILQRRMSVQRTPGSGQVPLGYVPTSGVSGLGERPRARAGSASTSSVPASPKLGRGPVSSVPRASLNPAQMPQKSIPELKRILPNAGVINVDKKETRPISSVHTSDTSHKTIQEARITPLVSVPKHVHLSKTQTPVAGSGKISHEIHVSANPATVVQGIPPVSAVDPSGHKEQPTAHQKSSLGSALFSHNTPASTKVVHQDASPILKSSLSPRRTVSRPAVHHGSLITGPQFATVKETIQTLPKATIHEPHPVNPAPVVQAAGRLSAAHPAQSASLISLSAQAASVASASVHSGSAKTAVVAHQPIHSSSIHTAPSSSLVHTPPVVQRPVHQTPITQNVALQTPVVQNLVYQAPVVQSSVHQAPVVQSPAHQAPVVQSAVYQAPVAQVPLQTAPVAHNLHHTAPVAHVVPNTAPAATTNTFQAQLIAAFTAALEEELRKTAGTHAAAATVPAHANVHAQIPTHHAAAATPLQAHATQQVYGGQMYNPYSPYGYMQQPMMAAHLYPAYMQEMMFGDTQDPPDPTVATPNTTTAAPEPSTPTATAAATAAGHVMPETTTDTVTSTEMTVADTTTDVPLTEVVTVEAQTTSTTEQPTETPTAQPLPVTTDIPLPGERKPKLIVEPLTKEAVLKLAAVSKSVKGLKGNLQPEVKARLLQGIKDIVSKSKVDFASLKSALTKKLTGLKTKHVAVEYTAPRHVTDPPSPLADTTLAPPVIVTKPTNQSTTSVVIANKKQTEPLLTQPVASNNPVKVRSLVDSGSPSSRATLEAILKEIASQSKGQKALPNDLKHVNFAEIAKSLTPKGTDLASQLSDPKFLNVLREIVTKLHSLKPAVHKAS